jgi:Domain of unknown function (DUF1876)
VNKSSRIQEPAASGDEVLAARALRRLADWLLGVASDDIKVIEGHEVICVRDEPLKSNGRFGP